ncbi:hypothetical protein APTSU1_001790100 [Apodemus speciosus]|uniref:Uncharacterized protein n=1 Tax=Apodemus speciosus TaxID=105296 RepID=A0ABQ0FTT4_APOSI
MEICKEMFVHHRKGINRMRFMRLKNKKGSYFTVKLLWGKVPCAIRTKPFYNQIYQAEKREFQQTEDSAAFCHQETLHYPES